MVEEHKRKVEEMRDRLEKQNRPADRQLTRAR